MPSPRQNDKLNALIARKEAAESEGWRFATEADQRTEIARWVLAIANFLAYLERGGRGH